MWINIKYSIDGIHFIYEFLVFQHLSKNNKMQKQ